MFLSKETWFLDKSSIANRLDLIYNNIVRNIILLGNEMIKIMSKYGRYRKKKCVRIMR